MKQHSSALGLMVILCTLQIVIAQTSTTHVCKGMDPDTCKNYMWNGFENESNPCPEEDACNLYSGIPTGNFFCQTCSSLPQTPGNQGSNCRCTVDSTGVVNVQVYAGACSINPDCHCHIHEGTQPQNVTLGICGGI